MPSSQSRTHCLSEAEGVAPEGRPPDALSELGADQAHDVVEADVLVVGAQLGLRGGREERLGEALALAQPRRQRDAADGAAAQGVLPAAAPDVATHTDLPPPDARPG